MMNRINWSFVKLSDDLGVFHVGGKTGAKYGPDAFELNFKKFRGKFDAFSSLQKTYELDHLNGNIRDHLNKASDLIKEAALLSPTTLIVGGGHDFGYSHLKGLKKDNEDISCINLDAHFDLRKPNPEITSGSPFYLAIEEGILKGEHFTEFGIQSHCNAKELWDYAHSKKITIKTLRELRKSNVLSSFKETLSQLKTKEAVLQLDLDCIAEAYAPGVSAPQSDGFTIHEILEIIKIAAKDPRIISLGIFELNPLLDQNFKTARLAAKVAHTFLEERFYDFND